MDEQTKNLIRAALLSGEQGRLAMIARRDARDRRQAPVAFFAGHNQATGQDFSLSLGAGGILGVISQSNIQPRPGQTGRGFGGGFDAGAAKAPQLYLPVSSIKESFLLRSLYFEDQLAYLGGDRAPSQASPDPVFGFSLVGKQNLIAGRMPDNTYFSLGAKNWEYQSAYSLQWGGGDFFYRHGTFTLNQMLPTLQANFTPGFSVFSPTLDGTNLGVIFRWQVTEAQENFWFFNTGPFLQVTQMDTENFPLVINREFFWERAFSNIPASATVLQHFGSMTELASPIGVFQSEPEFPNPGECNDITGNPVLYSATTTLPGLTASIARDFTLQWVDSSTTFAALQDGQEISEQLDINFSRTDLLNAAITIPARNKYTNSSCIYTGGLTGNALGKHRFNRAADTPVLQLNHAQSSARTLTGTKKWALGTQFTAVRAEVENNQYSFVWTPLNAPYSTEMSATFTYQYSAETTKTQLMRRVADDLAESGFYSIIEYLFTEEIDKTETRTIKPYPDSILQDDLTLFVVAPPTRFYFNQHDRLAPVTTIGNATGVTTSMSGSATQSVESVERLRFFDGANDSEVGYYSTDDLLNGLISADLSSVEVGAVIPLPSIRLKLRGKYTKTASLPSDQNFLSGISPVWEDYSFQNQFLGKIFIVQNPLEGAWEVFICQGVALGTLQSTVTLNQALNSGSLLPVGQQGIFINSSVQVLEKFTTKAPLLVSGSKRFFRFHDVNDLLNSLYSFKHMSIRKSADPGVIWDCYVANVPDDGVGAKVGYYTKFQVRGDYSLGWDRKALKSGYISHLKEFAQIKFLGS